MLATELTGDYSDQTFTGKLLTACRTHDFHHRTRACPSYKELGGAKAAAELGIPENTMYTWTKAAREGRLNVGPGAHTPETAMSLAEELAVLRKQVKKQEKEIRRLKGENEFLEEASAFSLPAVGSQQKPENEVYRLKGRGRCSQRKAFLLLPDAESNPAGIL